MSALEAALAFVFVSNAVFLVAAAVVLYRILDHTRVAHEALVHAADETRNAGKQLQHLAHASHEKLGKLTEGGDRGAGGDGAALDRLTRLVQDLIAKQGGGAGEGAATFEAGADKARDKEKGDRPHRSELDRALAHNHRLRASLEQIRLQLDDALKTIADMRRDERVASTETLENMRELVTRLSGQLEQARRKTRESEKRALVMEGELQQVRSMIDSSQSREDLSALEQRLDQMQSENSHLTGEVGELKDLIKRTLREKDFIEDRFLKLDSALGGEGAGKAELLTPEAGKPKAQAATAAF